MNTLDKVHVLQNLIPNMRQKAMRKMPLTLIPSEFVSFSAAC
jgi:hypothetical protein